jgi:lysophospholipase L1-like esterase
MSKHVSPKLPLRATVPVVVALLLLGVAATVLVAQEPAKPSPPTPAVTTDPAARTRPPLPVPANPKLPSLFLVGDSTVRNGRGDGGQGQWGWGEPLVDLFDTSKINVVNRAIGGHSSRSYIASKQWDETLALIKPGDIVLFQWGHNDGGPLDDPARSRGSIHGIGDESQEVDNPVLKIHETVHTYGWYLRKYIADVKAKGATPVICSLVPRKIWTDGKVHRSTDTYRGWAQQVADQQHVGFVDLNEIIARRYDALGPGAVDALFGDPHTHTDLAGAQLNAECVVSGLRALPGDPVAKYLSDKGKAILPYKA